MNVLVTGGAGFIGSHTVVELLQAGEQVVVVDNFCNSSLVVLQRIAEITGIAPQFVEADIRDREALWESQEFRRSPSVPSKILSASSVFSPEVGALRRESKANGRETRSGFSQSPQRTQREAKTFFEV